MKQIIAMGGGGFSMEPENLLLDRYILEQSAAERPKVCFLGTASGDSPGYIERFYTAFRTLPCEPSHLSLFKLPESGLEKEVLDQDVIYVGGGNTRSMLALWREWGLNDILREAYERGIVLAGLSAGSICWFEEGVTDSVTGRLGGIRGLGILSGSHCPHYDGEEERRPAYHALLRSGEVGAGIAADDGAALHYRDGKLYRVATSRPRAGAYRVEALDGEVSETALEIEPLF
ncbi:Type 1 glutamine amidotransferase-like domain-containing protein [Saccharibacillus alkalitolerans]|uniref:Peptidase E n=1 Tax=Saccharibacillus alkalitolerans TaxID=2705290 RepID=A0ABX0F9J6_9BACL|nr:Type 1 glutamine amidotransferase-like domain-containing protein [Saccharibacillus alkalitolerans]NGZ76993.1 peptidase E [Saccharibacillus alkalitolerans]